MGRGEIRRIGRLGRIKYCLLSFYINKVPSSVTDGHQEEILVFEDHVQSEVDFRHMTYQDLFKTVRQIAGIDPRYISYLEERYF